MVRKLIRWFTKADLRDEVAQLRNDLATLQGGHQIGRLQDRVGQVEAQVREHNQFVKSQVKYQVRVALDGFMTMQRRHVKVARQLISSKEATMRELLASGVEMITEHVASEVATNQITGRGKRVELDYYEPEEIRESTIGKKEITPGVWVPEELVDA